MHKLKSFGICENSLLWFKSYLCNREQCVVWSDILSKPRNITIGVPQVPYLALYFLFCL